MNINITTRFEINALDRRVNPARASEFAIRNACPAIVTVPEFAAGFVVDRASKLARHKIILMVDFPAGKNFAMQKLRDLGPDATAADGFDIVCTPGLNGVQAQNEIKTLSEFMKTVNPLAEVRWVISAFDRPLAEFEGHLAAIKNFPCSFVRLDPFAARADLKLTVEDYKTVVNVVRKQVVTPIKISGNVTPDVFEAFKDVRNFRFDVTLEQAEAIVKAQTTPKEAVKPNEQKAPEAQKTGTTETGKDEKVIGTLGQDVK